MAKKTKKTHGLIHLKDANELIIFLVWGLFVAVFLLSI